jgi:hypothetical protein
MKIKFFHCLILAALLLSCDDDKTEPLKRPVILPLRLELDDYKRELIFDSEHKLSRIKMSSFMPGDVVLESTMEYHYTADGKLEKAVTDNGFRLQFTFDGDKIIRTDQFINDVLSEYYTFSYDDRGRLKDNTTWQEIEEEGGLVPKSKEIYFYDSNDNLTSQFLYFYNSGIQGHELLTTFEYSDYDDRVEAESLFNGYSFNPLVVFRKNNPGKTVTKNKHGNTVLIEHYSYIYNSHGYATRKTTYSIFPYNGSSGSYETFYYYEER